MAAPDYYAQFASDPFWQRIIRDHPELEQVIRDKIETAYRRGGEDAVVKALFELGQEIGATYIVKYMPLAREDQIPKFIDYYVTSLDALNAGERPLCYYWFFDSSPLSAEEMARIGALVGGGDLFQTLIETAHDEMPSFDRERGEELQTRSIAQIQSRYGDSAIDYLAGSLTPGNTEQEAMYCSIFHDLYKFMQDLQPDDQVAQYRYVFE